MNPPATNPAKRSTPERHRPLDGYTGLDFLPGACLSVRAGASACHACVTGCPVQVLVVDSDGPHVGGDCLRCGRCAAACPTGALNCAGFDEKAAAATRAPVRVECQRVPVQVAGAALRVPCLGGIALAQVLEWSLQADPYPVHLVDRGGCAGCAAATGGRPAADELLERARPWLSACGVPVVSQPVVLSLGPPDRWLPVVPAAAEPTLSRRGFFRRVTTDVGQARPASSLPVGPRSQMRTAPPPMPARVRWLAAVEALAVRYDRPRPAAALFRIEVADGCTGHGLCASGCPSGALERCTENGASELRFDAMRCVGCGRCATACPERAITLNEGGQANPVVLRRTAVRECVACGSDFEGDRTSQALCPRCRQGQDLARSLFALAAGMDVAGNEEDRATATTREGVNDERQASRQRPEETSLPAS